MKELDAIPFWERVDATKGDIIDALTFSVQLWTEREIELGHNPMFEKFVHEFPEWNHEVLYATIGEVMHRVKHRAS